MSSPGLCAMLTQTSRQSTTRTLLAMPSGLRLRSSLSGSGRTSLNWSQTPNWSQLQQLKRRKERTWRKRVGVEPTIRPAKDRIAGFEGRERHRTLFASANSIVSSLQTLKETSGALGSKCGGLLSADQSGDEVVECRSGADFIIGMRSGPADFSIRKQLSREGLS